MNKLTFLASPVGKLFTKVANFAKKSSPEILLVGGILVVGAGTVMACNATLKVDDVLDEAKGKIEKIKDARATVPEEKYSERDYKKDMAVIYVQTGFKLAKLYGPAVVVSVVGIGCITGSHGVMKKRNLGLMAAYKALEHRFDSYSKRVVEEYGETKDYQFKNGLREETVMAEDTDEATGKKKKVKKTAVVKDPNEHSVYARFFDSANKNWSKTPEFNFLFLKNAQNYANDKLIAQGHLFLNEVYDMLDIPRSQAGAVVGWVLSKDGTSDNCIDFGLYDYANRDLLNGYETEILIDFNVDGVIYDLI